jgi:POT family proton-dependent oligopeptide transporter
MEHQFGGSITNQKTIIGHPVGLFVIFLTEMWERFSYYGMRAIFVLYLISELSRGGMAWSRADALVLYGWYTGLVYLTPLLGGWIADTKIGFRNAVVLGALIMTIGHGVLAFETLTTFYIGIAFLIIGNGLFKPNMTPIIGQMYKDTSPLKDGAYTIFYMGVNAGGFLGILICGWLGETKGWSYGFGAAGIFMFFGMLQFYFGQKIFGKIGEKPTPNTAVQKNIYNEEEVPFAKDDKFAFISMIVLGLITIIAGQMIEFDSPLHQLGMAVPFIASALYYTINRLKKYPKVEKDRLTVISVFAFFTVFFWVAFEQAGGTMTIFADSYTDRVLSSPMEVTVFRYVSLALTFIPMLILTWIIVQLGVKIFKDYPATIIATVISFLIIWFIIITINMENFTQESAEVPASWFGTLNSFFIVSLAPLFSTLWTKLSGSPLNPSGPIKFATGLFLLSLGFATLVIGASDIPQGAQTASVSMIWLVLAYFFNTVGELCLSPVGLSFVNKLSPKRLIAMMFGVWYLANFIANFMGGIIGSYMDKISETSSLAGFFTIFVVVSALAGFALVLLNKPLKRMMHGIN